MFRILHADVANLPQEKGKLQVFRKFSTPNRSGIAFALGSCNSINPGRNMTKLQSFHQDQSGATIVEYAIMLALIAAVCFAAITLVGLEAGAFWGSNADQVSEVVSSNRAPIN
jgi:Flp pilus assembly pilin Flp